MWYLHAPSSIAPVPVNGADPERLHVHSVGRQVIGMSFMLVVGGRKQRVVVMLEVVVATMVPDPCNCIVMGMLAHSERRGALHNARHRYGRSSQNGSNSEDTISSRI